MKRVLAAAVVVTGSSTPPSRPLSSLAPSISVRTSWFTPSRSSWVATATPWAGRSSGVPISSTGFARTSGSPRRSDQSLLCHTRALPRPGEPPAVRARREADGQRRTDARVLRPFARRLRRRSRRRRRSDHLRNLTRLTRSVILWCDTPELPQTTYQLSPAQLAAYRELRQECRYRARPQSGDEQAMGHNTAASADLIGRRHAVP